MRKLITIILILAMASVGPILSCGKKERAEIKIGWIGALTGNMAYYGESIKNATEIGLHEINEKGVNGKKLTVIYEDDELKPEKGVTALNKLINLHNVPLVIEAAGSSVMLAQAPIAEKNKIVLISPTCSNYKIKDAGDYIFRVWPSDDYQGKVLASFAFNALKSKSACVLYINNDYGVGVKEVFVEEFQKLGGQVLSVEGFDEGTTDFRTPLSKISSLKPNLLFLSAQYKEGALITKQARELGVASEIIASDGCFAPDLITLSGNAAEGVYVSNMHWDPESKDPIVQNFVKRYEEQYGRLPEAYAAAGYDCIKVVADAIRRGGETAEGIKQALYGTKGFRGVTGETSFDEYGEVSKEYDIFRIQPKPGQKGVLSFIFVEKR